MGLALSDCHRALVVFKERFWWFWIVSTVAIAPIIFTAPGGLGPGLLIGIALSWATLCAGTCLVATAPSASLVDMLGHASNHMDKLTWPFAVNVLLALGVIVFTGSLGDPDAPFWSGVFASWVLCGGAFYQAHHFSRTLSNQPVWPAQAVVLYPIARVPEMGIAALGGCTLTFALGWTVILGNMALGNSLPLLGFLSFPFLVIALAALIALPVLCVSLWAVRETGPDI